MCVVNVVHFDSADEVTAENSRQREIQVENMSRVHHLCLLCFNMSELGYLY